MEFRAINKFVRVSPRKAKLVVDLVRGKNVNEALNVLKFTNKRSSYFVDQLIRSALANVQNDDQAGAVDVDQLYVHDIRADKGPTLKRWYPKAMGRSGKKNKPSCHISVVLRPEEESILD